MVPGTKQCYETCDFTGQRRLLRHCATSRKISGSIPDGVIGIFHWHDPSGRTAALGSTQPLTEMSIKNISWGIKATGTYGWQPYHLHVPIVLKSGSLNLMESSGPVQGLLYLYIYFLNYYSINWPASWSGGRSFWLLITRYWVRFPALPWGFSLWGEDPRGDHGLGS